MIFFGAAAQFGIFATFLVSLALMPRGAARNRRQ